MLLIAHLYLRQQSPLTEVIGLGLGLTFEFA